MLQYCYFGKESTIQQVKDRPAAGTGLGSHLTRGGHSHVLEAPSFCVQSDPPSALQPWQHTAGSSLHVSVVDSNINLCIPVEKFSWGCDLDARRKITVLKYDCVSKSKFEIKHSSWWNKGEKSILLSQK